jgi:glycosyltransferase involved in cell wall biosynthesis
MNVISPMPADSHANFFSCSDISGRSVARVTGVVFAIIHYNRIGSLGEVVESVLRQASLGDCLLLIDNGSSYEARACAEEIFACSAHRLKEILRFVFISTPRNSGSNAAYLWLFNYLLGSDFKHATHLVLLGDDDLLLPEWRKQVEKHFAVNNMVAWGFNYFNWISREIKVSGSHSGSIVCVPGELAHKQWLDSIAGNSSHHGRQEHSSAFAISLHSLRLASRNLATIVPMPYGDVGLALVMAYSDSLIYIDKCLGLIGRGTNYGMGSADRMAANHPTRGRIAGRPSHSKYLAATYLECVLLLGRENLIERATKHLIKMHLVVTYGRMLRSGLKTLRPRNCIDLSTGYKLFFEDLVLFLAVFLYRFWPWFFDRITLWMLGVTRSFSLDPISSIKCDFIKSLPFVP